ncbi:MAG: sulfite exporter TauE/SafE family protein [Candidatus Omnitrophica bacterium]|nr:sulfite exporter TauE/SafE family protein [Candidatus Omnitrophota bacterium]
MSFFIQPFLAGLSVGFFCLSYCFPFLASLMASEQRERSKNMKLFLNFMLGRFFGYLLFGFVISWAGERLQFPFLHMAANLALILISLVLLLYMTGLIKKDERCLIGRCPYKNTLVMGFLMGINICPPFLMSLTYVFSLHSMLGGTLYFLIFYLASSLYFLPVFFIELLAKIKEFRIMARLSGILCACLFIIYGIYSIGHLLIKHS